ncbi:MAG TPA: DUF5131 family protein, partial [Blastocatellia bacterium]|nr:DUF5131 family protein [Blastocatellia bacterium]
VHPQWAYSLRDQCVSSGVKFFWKQWGEWLPLSEQDHADPTQKQKFIWPDGREYDGKECITPNCAQVSRVGKKEAGRLIAGVEWNQMPEVQ